MMDVYMLVSLCVQGWGFFKAEETSCARHYVGRKDSLFKAHKEDLYGREVTTVQEGTGIFRRCHTRQGLVHLLPYTHYVLFSGTVKSVICFPALL